MEASCLGQLGRVLMAPVSLGWLAVLPVQPTTKETVISCLPQMLSDRSAHGGLGWGGPAPLSWEPVPALMPRRMPSVTPLLFSGPGLQ